MATSSKSKRCLSSDCTQLEYMKLELLVIATARRGEYVPGLVHTARHTMGIGSTLRQGLKPLTTVCREWGEVVTR